MERDLRYASFARPGTGSLRTGKGVKRTDLAEELDLAC